MFVFNILNRYNVPGTYYITRDDKNFPDFGVLIINNSKN